MNFQRAGKAVGGLFNRINEASQRPTFGLGIGLLQGNPQAGFQNAFALQQAAQARQSQEAQAQQGMQAAQARAQQQAFDNDIATQRLDLERQRVNKPGAAPSEVQIARFLTDDPLEQRQIVQQTRTREERRRQREQRRLEERLRLDQEKLELERRKASGSGNLTEGERKFATFARLANNAQDSLTAFENDDRFNPTLVQPGQLNLNRNPRGQQYQAAKRTFIDAIIRPMTGAAVTQFEFDSAERRYFPQLGDDEATVKFKQKLREEAIEAIRQGSGRALQQINGASAAPQITQPPAPTITIDAQGNIVQ